MKPLAIAILLAAQAMTAQAEIFKCVEGGKTTYANSPCNREQRERIEAEAAAARRTAEEVARKQSEAAARARDEAARRQQAIDDAVRNAEASSRQRTIDQDRAIFEQCMKDFQDPLTDPGVRATLRGVCAKFRDDFRAKWRREP
ncbi:MAG: DUF4124 domain-containing protein [Zoogloeaceae bacterium]|nr:DUF4124 domain-containing protein [Zoogloeaceae bacterium]